jgi:hypothetical protein
MTSYQELLNPLEREQTKHFSPKTEKELKIKETLILRTKYSFKTLA